MKKTRFFGMLLSVLAAIMMIAGLCACDDGTKNSDDGPQVTYELSLSSTLSYALHVGDEVDFTAYFTITDGNGTTVPVTGDMLDLSKVDLTAPGSFVVTLTYGGKSVSATFTVEAKQEEGPGSTTPDPDKDPEPDDPEKTPAEALEDALKVFADNSKWNFAVTEKDSIKGETSYESYYEYLGYNVLNRYDEDGETYTDYLGYNAQSDIYSFYYDNGDGTYEIYAEDGDDSLYYEYFVEIMYLIDPSALLDFEFTYSDGKYSAKDVVEVGNAVLGEFGEYDDDDNFTPYPWTVFDLYLGTDGKVSKIVAVYNDITLGYTFSDYGTVNFTLPDVGTTPDTPSDQFTPLTSPVAGEYYMGMLTQDGKYHYITGSMAAYPAQYYMATTTSISGAIKVTLAGDTTNGWTIRDANGKYIEIELSGTHINAVYSATSTMKWTWDTVEELFILVNGSNKYFLGTHGDLTTVGGVDYAKYIDTNYRLVLGTYGTQTPDTPVPDTPETPTDEAKIDAALAKLTDRKIFASTVLQSELDGVALTWSTDTVLSGGISFGGNSITVTSYPAKDTPIAFTVTAKLNDTTKKKSVTVTVSAFDSENLQDKLAQNDKAIGLPSVGTYHALVIPVQFSGETISSSQLDDLEKAFNGTEAETGWESVKTYYQKASYGKLNLTFDVQEPFKTTRNASYYESYSSSVTGYDGARYKRSGDELLLTEALGYYESRLDLNDYDYNKDGVIDGVYLIYSHEVDYVNADFFWAYTTWFYGTETYDDLNAGYYFFAGLDFMTEKTENGYQGNGTLPGIKINAETYIHETGHMLGLDDYYDYVTEYDEREGVEPGCNQGLGGADMMDYNIGDHGVYSKTMLGWLTPTIVSETMTVTLTPSATEASAVLIPIDFNNSYFCEYLMVDLYAATGLNEMHSSDLYDGASFGVRIYHVSSSIENPFNEENGYESLTDYNNSTTDIPLIKLVEADGGNSTFSDSDGLATANDLWKAGQKLSAVFSSYKGNDGKKVNFDIEILSVSATEAQITITFNN